jgi:hypothetical protein
VGGHGLQGLFLQEAVGGLGLFLQGLWISSSRRL